MFSLSEGELRELRTAAEQSLFETCTIYHSTGEAQDEYGQERETYETIEDVPCGLEDKLGLEDERSNQVILRSGDALMRVRLDQEIGGDDYVTVRNKSYAVDSVHDGLTVRRVVLKLTDLPEGI
jgi:hypothetical protein